VLDEQALDEEPGAPDLARGDSAGVRKALKRLRVDLQKPCCFFQIQRGRLALRPGRRRIRYQCVGRGPRVRLE
jgi:hypothetical protein